MNRVAGALDKQLYDVIGLANDDVTTFYRYWLGQTAPILGESEEVDPSVLWEVKSWREWADQKSVPRPRHPMITYFEGVMDRYDTERATDKLRRFIEGVKNVPASQDDDDW